MYNPNNQHTYLPSHNLENSYPSSGSDIATDYGANPFVVDIGNATMNNDTFLTALWTGNNLQLTLMSIPAGDEIGLEVHPNDDQFLHIESGHGVVQMGKQIEALYFQQPVFTNSAIFVPAGIWHNIINTGNIPLKLYSIYAPPHHPWGTVHQTKATAETATNHY